jgi:membrane-associated phospholipid phosphatase
MKPYIPILFAMAWVTPGVALAQDSPTERDRWAGRTYELNALREVPLILIPSGVAVGWLLNLEHAAPHCAPLCDKAKVNGFDRAVAGNYSATWRLASDLTVAGGMAAGLVVLFAEEGFFAGLNDLVVIAESVLWTSALCIIGNMAARRPRPYLYSEKAPLEERNSGHGSLSFLSGHAGTAAALTTSLFSTLRRRDPDGGLQWWVLGVGIAVTAAVAVGRTQAGDHFPTDVLLGAMVGTGIGLLVPYLHDSPVNVAPAVGRGRASLIVNVEL